MTLQEILREVFNPDIILPIVDQRLEIIEQKNVAMKDAIGKVIISEVPDNSFAVKLDFSNQEFQKKHNKRKSNSETTTADVRRPSYQQLTWLANKNHNRINKKCDFIIFTPEEKDTSRKKTHDKKYVCEIILGEIKTTIVDESVKNQLVNSLLFLEYIWSMILEYYDIDVEAIFKFVVVTKVDNRKKFTIKAKVGSPKFNLRAHDEPSIVSISETDEVTWERILSAIR